MGNWKVEIQQKDGRPFITLYNVSEEEAEKAAEEYRKNYPAYDVIVEKICSA